ncbi:MAG: threonylcarbamoyl-AMP synthase [Methanobacteriota archaeon]|jgi:L-threonylcarbamoyladenylate synthase|nr:MAG: threonylcarbamoyl-AMP synthase [Euryarchaeota archaeon]
MISIEEAREAIRNGEIVIYPTDTVLGMGCDPFNQTAVDKLFEIKGKQSDGLSIMLNNKKEIYNYCEVNKKYEKIISDFLPGPITLIMKSKKKFAKGVTKNGNIAIRIPLNKTANDLAKDKPVITTSANIHGEKIAANIKEAKNIFQNNCYYLDGDKPTNIESTIIDLSKDQPEIRRIGALYSTILEGMFEF